MDYRTGIRVFEYDKAIRLLGHHQMALQRDIRDDFECMSGGRRRTPSISWEVRSRNNIPLTSLYISSTGREGVRNDRFEPRTQGQIGKEGRRNIPCNLRVQNLRSAFQGRIPSATIAHERTKSRSQKANDLRLCLDDDTPSAGSSLSRS